MLETLAMPADRSMLSDLQDARAEDRVLKIRKQSVRLLGRLYLYEYQRAD
jgi:hypothetical protein